MHFCCDFISDGISLSGGHILCSIQPPFTITIGDITNEIISGNASLNQPTTSMEHPIASDVILDDFENEIGGDPTPMNFEISKYLLVYCRYEQQQ